MNAIEAGLLATAIGVGIIAGATMLSPAPAAPASAYHPLVMADLGDNPADSFALTAIVLVDGRAESFVADRNLSRAACEAIADYFPAFALDDIGVRIAVETADSFAGWRVKCIAERRA